ncbi:DUF3040 domain-containing protein [Saccharopolyspora rhizosphaerae]|uniref:DUF3040 domain-containing protein n=1 Tax=Saccharopolyspora rhizosphaerae TaxID=2492662 RepID=A0A3R8R761_9PSEU|nr:DUF3040 domain-containing protein [Saccharopolyspora rhizosphaerae]RRO19950.1 DUF3040 domain-containing protein [Saccharopolyspora rhizosphaerae]
MLPRDERRRLREIEQQLVDEDPRLARKLSQTSTLGYLRARVSVRLVAAAFAGVLAIMCLFLDEGVAALTSAALAGLLMISRTWRVELL